ncbi:serine/threonine-protein kinase [Sorangium cellulosum]|uniref:serine/threonine-protein kinase n=1 Tax=Sorangium cellulosum TaxID=56 RepID=UPI0003FF438B|nr:serine/threonine-protein kinase [Sorangium cellulosum]
MTAPNVAPGSVVAGRFSVRSLLGYGGATATYRAVTAQARDVALKLYSPIVGQRPDAMQHLQRYVAETNRLPHDLVAHILEAGYDPATAAPFTVTDTIHVPSLAELALRRPLSFEEVGAMLRSLAAVLDAAHAREVPHHGLKPTNLFLDPSAPGSVKVTDFGPSLARSMVPTPEGYVLAAPWLAPEQLQPGAPAGPAADIFSAALVAFFALTGRSYWRSCQGQVDVPAWQREIMAPRPSASARAAELGVPVSPVLDAAFARALAHDPRERFRSASELAAMLSGFSAGAIEVGSTLALSPSANEAPAPAPPARAANAPAPVPPAHAVAAASAPAPMPAPDATQLAASPFAPAPPPTPFSPAPPHSPLSPSPAASPSPQPPVDASFAQAPAPPSHAAPAAPPKSAIAMMTAVTTPRSPWGKAASLTVGVVAVLLVGGTAAAWYVMDRREEPQPSPSASATASAAVPAPTAEPTQPAPAATAPPADAGAPATAPPIDAGAPADAGVASDPLVKISCKPVACEEITIDGKTTLAPEVELGLKPGVHKVSVRRTGYIARSTSLVVKAGTPLVQEFQLTEIPPAPAQPAGQATNKPCGKFLKRCK